MLGRLPEDALLGGALRLDGDRVRSCFARFAAQLNCSPEEAATGIIQVANVAMYRALRHISVERGHNPNDFMLLSFGGAGGLHACDLADALGIEQVLVPRFPGAFSALGLALADTLREYVRAFPAIELSAINLKDARIRLQRCFDALAAQASRDMAAEGFPSGTWHGERLLDMRYVGQSFELRVPVAKQSLRATCIAFHSAHRARYGHSDAKEPVEITAARLIAVGRNEAPQLCPNLPTAFGEPIGETQVRGERGSELARIYRREVLAEGQEIAGPALVLQSDATTFVTSGWHGRTDPSGNLILRRI